MKSGIPTHRPPGGAPGQKTYAHLAGQRRVPSEYELASSNLLYYTRGGFELKVPVSSFYERHQQASPLRCADWELFRDPRETTYTKYTALQRNRGRPQRWWPRRRRSTRRFFWDAALLPRRAPALREPLPGRAGTSAPERLYRRHMRLRPGSEYRVLERRHGADLRAPGGRGARPAAARAGNPRSLTRPGGKPAAGLSWRQLFGFHAALPRQTERPHRLCRVHLPPPARCPGPDSLRRGAVPRYHRPPAGRRRAARSGVALSAHGGQLAGSVVDGGA